MINLKQINMALLLTLGSVGVANAGVIDSFNYDLSLSTSAQGDVDTATFLDTALTTPSFDITYTLTNIVDTNLTQNGNSTTDALFGDGNLYYAEASGVSSDIKLEYSFPTMMESVDLTDAGGSNYFYFDVVEIDQGFDYTITVTDTMSGISTFSTVTTGNADGTRAYISFNSFTGNADFTKITKFVLDISSPGGSDFTLTEIGTVPEPTGLAVLGLGLLGLANVRRKKA